MSVGRARVEWADVGLYPGCHASLGEMGKRYVPSFVDLLHEIEAEVVATVGIQTSYERQEARRKARAAYRAKRWAAITSKAKGVRPATSEELAASCYLGTKPSTKPREDGGLSD